MAPIPLATVPPLSEAMQPWMFLVAAALFGLVFGSFANVVIYRTPRKPELAGTLNMPATSYCPACRHPIRFYDNIPLVSFILLRGKCRDCGEPIPWRYPAVELLSGIAFGAAMLVWGPSVRFAIAAWFVWNLIVLAFIDGLGLPADEYALPAGDEEGDLPAVVHVLPDRIVLPAIAAAVGFAAVGALVERFGGSQAWLPLIPVKAIGGGLLSYPLVSSLGGMLSAGAFLLVLGLLWKGGMGGGDIKLTALLGLVLGWYVFLAVFIASLLGAVTGLAQISSGARGRKDRIPFGPFLAAGAALTLFFGPALYGAYLSMVGS
jgi:leader peptidase (prepilin peptidase) / N-methyltransferase